MGRRKKDDFNKFDKAKYSAYYHKEKMKAYTFRFNKRTDADIIEKLDSVDNKMDYLRSLFRK